jgi:MoaA/NifB/PqqE/SkfB family radical SAM enzyme
MSREDFHAAIQLAKDHDGNITIGGGEPTLHPLFSEFLMYAVWELACVRESLEMPSVHIVTNGSNTELALNIARLAKQDVISAAVSKDQYHDPIDPIVYTAFETPTAARFQKAGDNRHINRGSGRIVPAGRAKSWGNHPSKCPCEAVFISPKGNVYPCGCRKTCLGNVSEQVSLCAEHLLGYCENDRKNYKEYVLDEIARNS